MKPAARVHHPVLIVDYAVFGHLHLSSIWVTVSAVMKLYILRRFELTNLPT